MYLAVKQVTGDPSQAQVFLNGHVALDIFMEVILHGDIRLQTMFGIDLEAEIFQKATNELVTYFDQLKDKDGVPPFTRNQLHFEITVAWEIFRKTNKMGDHYCCRACNQRYDLCLCKPQKSMAQTESVDGTLGYTKPKPQKKVMLQLNFDGTGEVIDIHKVVGVKADIPTLFIVERMNDGGHRLTFNNVRIPDLTAVQGLTFIRQPE